MNEQDVRALRALVFGECSDGNWIACRAKWVVPENLQWLREHSFSLP